MQCKKMDRFYLKLCQKKCARCCVRMNLCWPLQCLHAELAESRSDNEFLYMLKHGMSMRRQKNDDLALFLDYAWYELKELNKWASDSITALIIGGRWFE